MTNTLGHSIGVGVIVLSTCFEAIGQFAFKYAADHRPTIASGPIASVWANARWIFLGFLGFIVDGLLWSVALYYLDISVAHPIGSLVFVVVAVLSKLFLHERVSARRWAGIGLILAGTACVAAT